MLEICIDGVASAEAAAEGGADRVELCANLPEGGTTPSAGMIRAVRSAFKKTIMVMIRPRGYDFLYSVREVEVMLEDIRVVRDLGADGVAFGCLTAEGRICSRTCERLMAASQGLDVTFHRAFDMTRDLFEAMEDIVRLGIRRILTSGGEPDVPSGLPAISALVHGAGEKVVIMPGGGVTEANLGDIVRRSGVREIHLSARDGVKSAMHYRNQKCGMGAYSGEHEYDWREASVKKVRLAKAALTRALAGPPEKEGLPNPSVR